MSKGVLILALGHSYYGNYAVQLCRSIKAVDPSATVAIAYNGSALAHNKNCHADIYIEVPEEYYTNNGFKDYFKTKTYVYNLSPFTETIYIDADVIWCPNKPITGLFDSLKDVDFTISNRGVEEIGNAKEGFIHWSSPKGLISEYGFNETDLLYNAASEFMYFKKNKSVKNLFTEAQKVYDTPPKEYRKFAHVMPDELAFEIAMLKTKVHPHQAPFLPFYWEQFERKRMPVYDIYNKFYGYSLGGNVNDSQVENIYNNLASHFNAKFGVNGYFPARSKKQWLTERQSI